MTDNEIIKAFECCQKLGCDSCDECPLKNDRCVNIDTDWLALDLLKRQKAEIEILIRKKEVLRDEIAEQQAEIQRLKDAYIVYEETTGLKQAKAEAIKEFGKLLIDKAENGIVCAMDIVDYVFEATQELKEGAE